MANVRIGEKVRRLREEQELTQAELARRASKHYARRVDPSHISRIESGEFESPRQAIIRAIAMALNRDVGDLLEDRPTRTPTPYEKNAKYRRLIDALDAAPVHDRERIIEFVLWLLHERGAGERVAADTSRMVESIKKLSENQRRTFFQSLADEGMGDAIRLQPRSGRKT